MLVPHSNCAADKGDLYAEYSAVRGDVAISKTDLLQITDTGGRQACTTFGVHPKLGVVRSLFADGDAAFFANIGALAEPITKAEFKAKTKAVPNSLFAHNAQQRTAANLHADSLTAKGVIGRMAHALASGSPLTRWANTPSAATKRSSRATVRSRASWAGATASSSIATTARWAS